jgi:hypothetical protein
MGMGISQVGMLACLPDGVWVLTRWCGYISQHNHRKALLEQTFCLFLVSFAKAPEKKGGLIGTVPLLT